MQNTIAWLEYARKRLDDYCFGVIIVRLLKNKQGDISKLDMYRGVTLSSCTFSKLFESTLSINQSKFIF